MLGSNPLLWLFPVPGPMGDGINFEVDPENLKKLRDSPHHHDEADDDDSRPCCRFEEACAFLGLTSSKKQPGGRRAGRVGSRRREPIEEYTMGPGNSCFMSRTAS